MNLFERYGEPCHIMNRITVKHPLGGYTTKWELGIDFIGAKVLESSTEARIAEAQGMKKIFTFVVDRSLPLKQNDVILVDKENKTYRVTSDAEDLTTPIGASVPNAQVTAERWDIPPEEM